MPSGSRFWLVAVGASNGIRPNSNNDAPHDFRLVYLPGGKVSYITFGKGSGTSASGRRLARLEAHIFLRGRCSNRTSPDRSGRMIGPWLPRHSGRPARISELVRCSEINGWGYGVSRIDCENRPFLVLSGGALCQVSGTTS